MFYGAEDAGIAIEEIRSDFASVATFATERTLRILDLATLPPIPSIFIDEVTRREVAALRFLHRFTWLIRQPVERRERTVLDYLPTQVFSEFLRDHVFEDGTMDGVRYPSAIANAGSASPANANVVLFADTTAVFDAAPQPDDGDGLGFAAGRGSKPWLRLRSVVQFPEEPLPKVQASAPGPSQGTLGPLFAQAADEALVEEPLP
jgi:hypothetical protein